MPMPPGIATVTLTGRYIRPDGTPLKGSVTFATPALLTLSGADTISAGSATVTLDDNGVFSVVLVATDNANMQPTGWAYQVTEKFQDVTGRTYAIQLPATTPMVDLADIAPADPSQGQYVLVPGPQGPQGPVGPTGPAGPEGVISPEQLATLAQLAGATFTGVVTIDGANFLVSGSGKGYRFRPLGSRLDFEGAGSDMIISMFENGDFSGAQHAYLRLESGVQLAHAIGKWVFAGSADGGAVHTLDGLAGEAGFFGAAPVARPVVTGSRASGAAFDSLLAAMGALGLIDDQTTA
ncbi:hypothetical protein ACQEVG_32730 [Streptomyces sp. CA-135486]|uniref:hypothetical protein n=1 Tax=Streptomyces sp. CA-135486 TaxID=3240049 RepID=UPI003D8DB73E